MTNYPDIPTPLDDLPEETKQRFTITDDNAAAWAMRKLRSIRSKQAEYDQVAVDERARIDRWLDEVKAPLDRDAHFFEAILMDYAYRCRENPDDGRKSIALPTGKVSTRSTQPKWTVDTERFVEWARAHQPDLIRVREDVDLTKARQTLDLHEASSGLVAISPDGEIVPGITVEPGGISATVTPDLT